MSEPLPAPSGEFLLCSDQISKVKVECRLQYETLCLTANTTAMEREINQQVYAL
jgi:hypothetical protein